MKKHLHNSLRALFLSLAVLLSLPMLAVEVEIDGIRYELVAKIKEATVIKNGYAGEVVIPESVEHEGTTYSVTSIGDAFHYCDGLKSVTIPNSVTSIGESAFIYCDGLTSVTIPNSVSSIGRNAFYRCRGLTSVTIPNSVTSIGESAFYDCSGLKSVTIGNSVTSIGESAFHRCWGLTSVTIPNSVTSIGSQAFFDCSGLTSVHISDIAAWCNIDFDSNPLSYAHHLYLNGEEVKDLVIPNSVKSIGESAFSGCSGLTSVTIPNSVKSIGDYTFSSCSGLTSVTIPNSVTSIGNYAFSYCSGLTSVTIPNSVKSIGYAAFYDCDGLTSVTIGSGVEVIGFQTFANCPDLLDVYCYAEKVPSTESSAFNGSYPEYATLHVPDGSVNSYRTTEPWSAFGTITSISGTVIPLPNITLTDGEEFENYIEQTVSCITYTRTLSKTNTWNALYVPFEIPMTAEFCQNYDVAYFNDVHCYDNYVGEKENGVLGQDGVIDGMDMEVLKAQEGSVLNANYPYLIRAKNTDALNMNIKVEDATLYSTKETTISCSSVFMKFDVTGIYNTQTAGELKGEYDVYAISDGGWKQALNANQQLKPFRLYLKLTSIDGSPVKATEGAMSRINIRVQGEDTETGIDELKDENGNVKTEIFDLSGRRVQKAQKGIFIQNGKKVIM